MTNINKEDLRIVHMDYTQSTDNYLHFMSNDMNPLQTGEWVKFDPENTGYYYNKPYDESRAVLGRVGRIMSVGKPYMALGTGETYEEMSANAHMVCLSYGEVAYADCRIPGSDVAIVTGDPTSWLPELDTID